MRTIQASKFKAQCLALLDDVAQSHESIIITKRGKPVAKVLPFDNSKLQEKTPLKGLATSIDDIISPLDDDWEASNL